MVIAAPLLVERIALRRARTPVVRTGMGPRRSRRRAVALGGGAVLVAGVGGGLVPGLRAGHVVVASEVLSPQGATVACWGGRLLVAELRRAGLVVHYGPIASTPRLEGAAQRSRLATVGALAADMESWWLAPPPGRPFAVVRALSDGVGQPLLSPAVVIRGFSALRALRRAVPALDAWVAAAAG